MGWMLYENHLVDPGSGDVSDFSTNPTDIPAAADNIALMFAWSDIEKTPGVYDFSAVDAAYDFWHARHKNIMLRMSTESLLFWSHNKIPAGTGIPDFVLANIPSQHKQIRTTDDLQYTVVDARDPAYFQSLEKFLHAVQQHFDRSRPVTLIDLRGYGVWGEWHSGYQYESPSARHAALCSIIDRWCAAFPDHYLALSYSYDPAGPAEYYEGPSDHFDPASTKHFTDYVHFSAFDYAMTKPNITLRRDGAGGAVHSNERLFNQQQFQSANKGPMTCEFVTGYFEAKKGGESWLRFLLDDALSLHPNYINLLGWSGHEAAAFAHDHPELISYGSLHMGYRLVPASITYDAQIHPNQPWRISMTWINRAVGRAVRDHQLILFLIDNQNHPIAVRNLGSIDLQHLLKDQVYNDSVTTKWPDVPPGHYILRMTVEETQDHSRIALPLKEADADRTYRIGEIECSAESH
jgi:hypothetical protein